MGLKFFFQKELNSFKVLVVIPAKAEIQNIIMDSETSVERQIFLKSL